GSAIKVAFLEGRVPSPGGTARTQEDERQTGEALAAFGLDHVDSQSRATLVGDRRSREPRSSMAEVASTLHLLRWSSGSHSRRLPTLPRIFGLWEYQPSPRL